MSEELIAAIVQVIGGGLVGFWIAWFTLRGQRKRQVLEIADISSTSLLGFGEVSRSLLEVSVDKSRLTGLDADKGQRQKISNAFGHRISLYNPGPETVGFSKISIEFTPGTQIIDHRFQPSYSDDFKIEGKTPVNNPNCLTVSIPYVNVEDTLQVSVLTTGDDADDKVKVRSISQGFYVERQGILDILGFSAVSLTFILVLMTALFLGGVRELLTAWFPGEYLFALGARREEQLVWSWPVWYDVVAGVAGVLLFAYGMWKISKLDTKDAKI